MMFFNFLIFFWEFYILGWEEQNLEQNFFFSLFLSLSLPSLDRNTARVGSLTAYLSPVWRGILPKYGFYCFLMPKWVFLFFLNFFCYFLEILYTRLGRNKIRKEFFFFSSFSAYGSSIWIEIIPEWGFLIFWIFFQFFFEILYPG